MKQVIIENPILSCPHEEPRCHFRFTAFPSAVDTAAVPVSDGPFQPQLAPAGITLLAHRSQQNAFAALTWQPEHVEARLLFAHRARLRLTGRAVPPPHSLKAEINLFPLIVLQTIQRCLQIINLDLEVC